MMLAQKLSFKRRSYMALMQIVMGLATLSTAVLVLFLLVYVLGKGIPHLSWELLSTRPSYLTERIGILPDILNTLYIVVAALGVTIPL
ncbi:MAG: hypothetical protein IJD16_03110, partial [Desulfovibrio sp.]|nr:hypothetical protein [Desulfovibrio sp.]